MINFEKATPSQEVLDKLDEEKAKVNGTYNLSEVVEASFHYGMPILHKRENVTITATVPETEKIRNTIELLHYVYNGKTAIKDIEAINIKKDLVEELVAFTGWLREYDDDELEEVEREELKRKIRKGLSPKSAFTAFKRQIVKDIPYLYQDFKEYIPSTS